MHLPAMTLDAHAPPSAGLAKDPGVVYERVLPALVAGQQRLILLLRVQTRQCGVTYRGLLRATEVRVQPTCKATLRGRDTAWVLTNAGPMLDDAVSQRPTAFALQLRFSLQNMVSMLHHVTLHARHAYT